jgi:hypothetical protein
MAMSLSRSDQETRTAEISWALRERKPTAAPRRAGEGKAVILLSKSECAGCNVHPSAGAAKRQQRFLAIFFCR